MITRQKEPKMFRKVSWTIFKLIDKFSRKGTCFKLSYGLIAKDASERLGMSISPETIRRYCRKLKQEGLIKITQVFRDILEFKVLDLVGLKRYREKIEKMINDWKPRSRRNSGARLDDSGARLGNLVHDLYLKSSLKSKLQSDQTERIFEKDLDPDQRIAAEASVAALKTQADSSVVSFAKQELKKASQKTIIKNPVGFLISKIRQEMQIRELSSIQMAPQMPTYTPVDRDIDKMIAQMASEAPVCDESASSDKVGAKYLAMFRGALYGV